MKKLLSLVLICAMGFGMISCVENVESPSVEAIRNAKAEQLKALANLYNAQAQAELILAQAEAALREAEAAFQQAQADYKLEQLEQLKQEFAYKIEMLKAQYESQMLMYKKQALVYEKEILDAMADLEDAVNARIAELYTAYSSYVESYNTASENILNKKRQLAQVELEIVDIQTVANKRIAEQEATIEEKIKAIAEYNAKLDILKEDVGNVDADSLYKEWLKGRTAYNNAYAKYIDNEFKAYTETKDAAENASNDYYKTYNAKVAEMNAMEYGIIGITEGDAQWTEEGEDPRCYITERYYGYKTVYVDDDNDPSTPDVAVQEICSWDDPNWEGYYRINGQRVIQFYYVEPFIDPWTRNSFEHLNVFINEAPLLTLKNNSAASYKNALDDVENYTEKLENAKAAETAAKGFEKAFADADAARKAIEAFKEAYEKYDEDTETVKAKEAALKQAISDTTGLHTAVKGAESALDVLTNEKNEGYKTNALVKALADAQEALEEAEEALEDAEAALAAAAEADKAAKQADVDAAKADVVSKKQDVANAQADLDKAIYNAEVALINAKKALADAEANIAEAEADVEEAKENEKALLAANAAAITAVETMNNTFGEDSDFYAFWTKEDEYGNRVLNEDNAYHYKNDYDKAYWFNNNNSICLLADYNEDGNPDLDLDAGNGLYKEAGSTNYVDFTAAIGQQYPWDGFEAPDFKELVEGYAKIIAQATDNLTDANKTVAGLEEWVSNWDAKEAELRAWVEAKNAEIEDVRAAYDAFAEAEKAKKAKEAEIDEMKTAYEAIMTKFNAATNWDSIPNQIAELEENIADAEEAIENAEKEIAKAKEILAGLRDKNGDTGATNISTIAYKEYLIETYENEIAELEADLEFYAQMIETTKAALDAAISAANAQ